MPVPPFPTGEQASGSQGQPKHDNPESEHPSKGQTVRPSNTQGPQPKTSNVRQEAFNKTENNQLQLHMVLRKTRINHRAFGDKLKPTHILLINYI